MEEVETLAESVEVTEGGNHTELNTTCRWSCNSLHCMEKMHTVARPFPQCHCRHSFDASWDLCSTHLRPNRCCSDRCYRQKPRWPAVEKKVTETVAEGTVEGMAVRAVETRGTEEHTGEATGAEMGGATAVATKETAKSRPAEEAGGNCSPDCSRQIRHWRPPRSAIRLRCSPSTPSTFGSPNFECP